VTLYFPSDSWLCASRSFSLRLEGGTGTESRDSDRGGKNLAPKETFGNEDNFIAALAVKQVFVTSTVKSV
jgi:hypothetical protein